MKKLSDIEMQKIEGGNSYITAAPIHKTLMGQL